jgi:hypothetical protein
MSWLATEATHQLPPFASTGMKDDENEGVVPTATKEL